MSARIICVAQQKGGAGKTTLVSNLAIAYLAAGKSVGLLDTDPQGSLGKWLDIREEMLGLDPKLKFATATPYGISRAIRTVGNEADVILIDTPPKADSDVRWVLRDSDLVLVPVSASQADVWATHDVLDLAERAQKPTHIVMNRTRAGTRVGDDPGSGLLSRFGLALGGGIQSESECQPSARGSWVLRGQSVCPSG